MIGPSKKLRILVLGYIVRGPMGGMTWHHLQYFLGLHRLGHDVYFLEDSGDTSYACYDPVRNVTDSNSTYGLRYASQVFKRIGSPERWAYYNQDLNLWQGPLAESVLSTLSNADILLNLSCSNPIRSWAEKVPVRVLIDTDPVFTQIRNLTDQGRRNLALQHNAFFTYGENYGNTDCTIPRDGFPWQRTRQPIVLDAWPVLSGNNKASFTTVMKWESYAGRNFEGQYFGMKRESFASYFNLPEKTLQRVELAVSDESAPRKLLQEKGWLLANPFEISLDPWTYQQYIQHSKAEFSIAKQGYVVSKSGWFSDRSATYLASGRPVLLEETGFSNWMETGRGLLSFHNPEQAVEGIECISKDYQQHCHAARAIAEEYFNAAIVLNQLINNALTKVC